ncbi:hypothetical protein [Persicitalea sp.]|uniref:hypothetical protein n=1 Tax=Persicitalea sp. TaxID=3100273 RepID=UPI0035945BFE
MDKIKLQVENVAHEYLSEIPDTWQKEDYLKILEEFGFADADALPDKELAEMTLMAITDEEPNQAAENLMGLYLADDLNEGQMSQIASDMQLDKIFEEYPEIRLHHRLFSINQLLRKAYNGKFPDGQAVKITFTLTDTEGTFTSPDDITSEVILKALEKAMPDNSIVKRLYPDQLEGKKELADADAIVWQRKVTQSSDKYGVEIVSSDYWLGDILDHPSYEAEIQLFKAGEEDDD